jgi:CRP-like cAMP-binding protein
MTEIAFLQSALQTFGGMSADDFKISLPYWRLQHYKKGEFYNRQHSVCLYLGFINKGIFRSYFIDPKSENEKNAFFYSTHQFVATFKSFMNQTPCDYFTQAMSDAIVLCIGLKDLLHLYERSHAWERFGRILAQEAFNVVVARAEGFLFKTPEELYLDLLTHHPDIHDALPLYHISSYLGIQGPSLSRIRKRIAGKGSDFNPG